MVLRPSFGLPENAYSPTDPSRGSHISIPKNASRKNPEHHLLEAIAAARSIKDEFYKGLAIRQVINVCRNANDIDIEKTLFKEVDHPLLREQIVKDAPELAEERGPMKIAPAEPSPYIWTGSSVMQSFIM